MGITLNRAEVGLNPHSLEIIQLPRIIEVQRGYRAQMRMINNDEDNNNLYTTIISTFYYYPC